MQWWLIAYLPLGSAYTYEVFQGTQAQAQAKASLAVNGKVLGPYPSQAAAVAAEKTQPTNPNATPVINLPSVPGIAGVQQIGTFFGSLGQANTWIRVGEVILGLILIAVGVARLTHAVPAITKVAEAVA